MSGVKFEKIQFTNNYNVLTYLHIYSWISTTRNEKAQWRSWNIDI